MSRGEKGIRMKELIAEITTVDQPDCDLAITASLKFEEDEKMAWMVAFGLLLAVATVGNSLVTWFIIGMLACLANV